MNKTILPAGLLLFSLVFIRAARAEDCIPFNPGNCRVDLIQGSYKIVEGTMWLLDFGSKKSEAIKALEVIQHYRLNNQCFVGRPQASMEYWLADGAAQREVYLSEEIERRSALYPGGLFRLGP